MIWGEGFVDWDCLWVMDSRTYECNKRDGTIVFLNENEVFYTSWMTFGDFACLMNLICKTYNGLIL